LTNFTLVTPLPPTRPVQYEGTAMLLHEALARSRMREAEQAAREYTLVRALTAGRRWRMLARYAQRRAAVKAAAAAMRSGAVAEREPA
jgi:hypothetical protein